MDLASVTTKALLFENLQNIVYIRGGLYVENNMFLNAMTFFSNLVGVESVYYSNLPLLVDARMPSLQSLPGNVTVLGCDRLCPARYTVIGGGDVSLSQAGCTNNSVNWYLYIVGPATVSDLDALANVTSRVLVNITNGEV